MIESRRHSSTKACTDCLLVAVSSSSPSCFLLFLLLHLDLFAMAHLALAGHRQRQGESGLAAGLVPTRKGAAGVQRLELRAAHPLFVALSIQVLAAVEARHLRLGRRRKMKRKEKESGGENNQKKGREEGEQPRK